MPFLRRRRLAPSLSRVSLLGDVHSLDGVPNQDATLLSVPLPPGRPSSLHAMGVFDGHGTHGHVAARLARDRMRRSLQRLRAEGGCLHDVVARAFEETAHALRLAECGQDSGTTATVAVRAGDELVLGCVGDSRAAVVGKTHVRWVGEMHSPAQQQERDRVCNAGGVVKHDLLWDAHGNTALAVSRALGDRDMAHAGCSDQPWVGAVQRRRGDIAIVVASDGLWDQPGVTQKDVARVVRRAVRQRRYVAAELAKWITRKCGKIKDDCSVVCMTLV